MERLVAFGRAFAETRMQILVAIGALSTFAFYALVVFPIESFGGHGRGLETSPTGTAAQIAAPLVEASSDAPPSASDAGAVPETQDAAPAEPVFRVADLKKDATVTVVEGAVGKHPLLAALLAAGVSHADTHRLLKAFDGVKDLGRARPKDTFVLAKEKQGGKLVAFEYVTSVSDVWQAREEDGALVAKKLDLPVEERRVALGLSVGADLRDSLVKGGLDDDMMGLLDDALEGRVELADIHPGTRMRLLATEQRVSGEFVRYSELDALEYVPADPHGDVVRVYRLPRDGSHSFYDAKGQQPTRGGWRKPVPLARIASRFNPHRMHPVLHVVMPHNGVDFAAPPGTPVYAAASGVVKSIGDMGPGGNTILLSHASTGLTSGYCHLSRFAPGLHVGTKVEVRQLIGYVGATGRVTGPHLHFSIKKGETFIDPLSLKLDGMRVVPPSDRDAFDAARGKLDTELDAVALPPPPEGWTSDAGPRAPDHAADEEKDENFDDIPPEGENASAHDKADGGAH